LYAKRSIALYGTTGSIRMTTDPQRYASLGGVPRAAGSGEKNISGRIFEMSSSDIDVAAGSYDSVWGRYRAVGVSSLAC